MQWFSKNVDYLPTFFNLQLITSVYIWNLTGKTGWQRFFITQELRTRQGSNPRRSPWYGEAVIAAPLVSPSLHQAEILGWYHRLKRDSSDHITLFLILQNSLLQCKLNTTVEISHERVTIYRKRRALESKI